MSQSRQLAAIMFTDIVGYTALMGDDEQKAFEILRKNRQLQKPLIEQHNGKWIKELGDGVLACFTTVSDAVNAAIKIQEGCNVSKDFLLRIGIHHGEVVFEDNDIFGDAVNIASRLQALAPIGGIWVSESVHNNVYNKREINTKFVGAETLKHVKEPVRIYEVITNNITAHPAINKNLLAKPVEKSLAVLPFADMSPAKDQEYLGDGLAEEMLNVLSQVKQLKVIGRTSSFSFKGTKTDLKTIGKILSADTILEGSIQKSGNRIRITAQLINASDGFHIWSQRYDRNMDDIFALQDDICSKIAENLKLTLLEKHETREEKKPTNNPKAYEWFLKADYYCKKYGWENFERAIDCCKKAIELDPDYADAWWLIGYCNFEKHGWLYFQKENIEAAIYCTNKAISIDKTNADAHFMLALINLDYYYNWNNVMSEIALANQYTRTPYPLFFLPAEAWIRGMLYSDFDFAFQHMQKGIDNDPLNFIINFI
jgi:TolB-like protein/class 3 adenylate cyclase